MKGMILAVAGAVLLSGAVAAMAQEPTSRPTSRPGPGAMLENAIKQLGLSDEQAQKVRDIFKTQGEAMQAFRQANGDKARDLETQLKAARDAKDDAKDEAQPVPAKVRPGKARGLQEGVHGMTG